MYTKLLNIFYSKMRPYTVAIDDILFKRPVKVGSLLYLSSQVSIYIYSDILVVEVVNKYLKITAQL